MADATTVVDDDVRAWLATRPASSERRSSSPGVPTARAVRVTRTGPSLASVPGLSMRGSAELPGTAFVDVFATAAASGRFLDVAVGSTTQQVRQILGPAPVSDPDRRGRRVRLDHGVVEVALEDGVCRAFTVQLHRLSRLPDAATPPALVERLGGLPVRVPFEDLRDALVDRGCDLRRLEPPWDGYEVVGRGARISVTTVDDGALRAGDVWAVAVTARPVRRERR